MSTAFEPNKNISFDDIKKFNHEGVRVYAINEEDESVILTDGIDYLWARPDVKVEVIEKSSSNDREHIFHRNYEQTIFTRYAGNCGIGIIMAIEDYFKVRLVPEWEFWEEVDV
jgi:hypothetical protein